MAPQRSTLTTTATTSVERVVTEPIELPRFDSGPTLDGSVVIGLDADMTSASAASGEAIRRGVLLAIDQINATGGLLGRPVELVVRDHRGNPDRGINNIRELAGMRNLAAIVGGIHTPVAIQELPVVHELEVVYLVPWAAGTPVVANGHSPNFVFRVSVRDEYAGGFLVRTALRRGFTRIALLLERTAWGRSNHTAMLAAFKAAGIEPVATEWMNWGEVNLASQMQRLQSAETDVVVLVCNPLEGVAAARALVQMPNHVRPAVISHWGITAGRFFDIARDDLQRLDFSFLQTFSFVESKRPRLATSLFEAYRARFSDCPTPADIGSPVGTAHAYEIVMMLAAAARNAGTIESHAVHDALESLENFQGLIRDYDRPFPPGHHDALSEDDFMMAEYDENGAIWPVKW